MNKIAVSNTLKLKAFAQSLKDAVSGLSMYAMAPERTLMDPSLREYTKSKLMQSGRFGKSLLPLGFK